MRRFSIAGVGVLLLVLAACSGESAENSEGGDDATGGSNGTGGSSGASSDWATACARSADILCDKLNECSPFFFAALFPNDCVALYEDVCRDLDGLPGATVGPTDVLRCYEAYGRMSCDDLSYNGVVPAECNLNGSRGSGSPCSNDTQCQSGSCSTSSGECGVCEVLATEGQSCFETSCAPELDCSLDSICVRPRHLGDACTIDAPCSILLNCTGGVCSKPPGPGAPCASDGVACDLFHGVTCNAEEVCETIDLPSLGEPCEGICEGGAYCSDDTTPAVCVPAPGEGDACNAELGPDCSIPFECTNGICARSDPASCG